MSQRTFTCTALILALLSFNAAQLWAVPGTVQLETGAVLEGDIRFPPKDMIELVLADSRDKAAIPVNDIKNIEVTSSRPAPSDKLPMWKRLWRRLAGPSEKEQTLTITLRNGEVYRGWLFWHQSAGEVEVSESKYLVRKVYLRPRQIDRKRHQPIDVNRQYVRSITFCDEDVAVSRECPKCGRLFHIPEYEHCPFDGTPLTERSVSAQE
jgi:hypothetical protein